MSDRRFRVILLGAGFSAPAGVPLAADLWRTVLTRIRSAGLGGHVDRDLETYRTYLSECFGKKVTEEEVNFEEFLGFLDLEYFLGLRGGDTWSNSGNESQVIVKTMIGQVLAEHTPPVGSVPSLYLRFAERLRPGDYVLTFNYDTLLERALEKIGKPFRLFPNRYEEVRATHSVIDSDRDRAEVVVLKMHGSIDWFDRTSYLHRCEAFDDAGLAERPRDPVFNCDDANRAVPLLEGPRRADDPLREVYRMREIERLYSGPVFFHATPFLILPSPAKVVFADRLKEFWWGLGQAGGSNLGCGVIGLSLAPHDEYAHQVVWRLVTNYQESWWDDEFPGGFLKAPAAFIDFRRTEQECESWQQRYRFVNWDRATVDLDGFREEALEQFFADRSA